MEANACVSTASRSYLELNESGFVKCSAERRMDCDSGLFAAEEDSLAEEEDVVDVVSS